MAELLPEGYYDAVCVPSVHESGAQRYAHLAVAKSGTRQVVAYFEIINAPDGFAGKKLPWYGAFTKDAGKRTVESLRFMGFTGDDLAAVEVQALDQIVSVTVEHHEWDGKVRDRIAWVNAAGGGVAKFTPMEDDAKRQFAAMMKASLATVPTHEGERYQPDADRPAAAAPSQDTANDGAPWPQENPPADGYDDIPF